MKIKVLFAEDENDIYEYINWRVDQFFSELGIEWEAKHAKDGDEASQFCQDEKFDFIVTDIKMPVMDGNQFVTYIRTSEDSLNKNTPVMVISSVPEQVINQDDLLYIMPKPFENDRLQRVLKICFAELLKEAKAS